MNPRVPLFSCPYFSTTIFKKTRVNSYLSVAIFGRQVLEEEFFNMSDSKLIYLQTVQAMKRNRMEQRAHELTVFDSVEAMDAAIGRFLNKHGEYLSESALILLAILSQHSCVVPGVSWLSVNSMAAYVGVSERTIQTALLTLERAGIIARVSNKDNRGGQTANFIVIQHYGAAEEITNCAAQVESGLTQIAAGNEHFTGGDIGGLGRFRTPKSINLLKLKKADDDNIKRESYRDGEFMAICNEWRIPQSMGRELLNSVREQLEDCSWLAVEQSCNKLLNNLGTISKVGPWFAEVLRQQTMLVQMGADRFKQSC